MRLPAYLRKLLDVLEASPSHPVRSLDTLRRFVDERPHSCKGSKFWWMRYYRDGRRFEESARTDKYEVARDLLKVREGDIAKGMPISSKIGRLRFEGCRGRSADGLPGQRETIPPEPGVDHSCRRP